MRVKHGHLYQFLPMSKEELEQVVDGWREAITLSHNPESIIRLQHLIDQMETIILEREFE